MDAVVLFKALLLGLLEGATEFLPVSSTGHLIIAGDLLDFNGEKSKTFKIFIQLGAILAIVWHYRRRVLTVLSGVGRDPAADRFLTNLGIAFLPAAALGFVFHKTIKTYLFNSYTVAFALIVGGFIIFWVEGRKRAPKIESVDQMGWRDALKVGLFQSCALFPGVSRAGATIMGGMLSGLSRPAATEFSFFLAIPTMLAATVYDLYKSRELLEAGDLGVLATGFVAAFFSALVVVKVFLGYVGRHSFVPFAYYRIAFGLLVLGLGYGGVVAFTPM